ncbi:lasso RiPP family leader peptide-containing protein [Paramicrobacterium agarici]|uniref:Lasso RiPP family leader peptide-containing protein n=1 Tax=Paramicrobacterium agarici TaxID=630514 RepID=A0A2A9DWZ1_9MICO|nr:lasso RiPP family leader peptide-containing protein [Microbacterium agarici]PFG30450.1 hypothetical protein ATJ78_1379 [Microbacterium agarici]
MAYESPKVTEIGRFSSVTLGDPWALDFDDNTYWWGGSSPKGSR